MAALRPPLRTGAGRQVCGLWPPRAAFAGSPCLQLCCTTRLRAPIRLGPAPPRLTAAQPRSIAVPCVRPLHGRSIPLGRRQQTWRSSQRSKSAQSCKSSSSEEKKTQEAAAMEAGASAKGPVLVTGASGFVGSWLVMKLLQAGYTVRATLRDPANVAKTKPLLDLPGAAERLSLWKADLAEEGSFDDAIKGCTGVFHVATPMDFESQDPENEVIKPTVDGMISIMRACKEAGTVRRIVFTSSAGTVNVEERRRPVYDEDNWTDVDLCRRVKMTGWMYFVSKTLAEKAAFEYAAEHGMDLISVIPTLVVGPFVSAGMPPSMITALALVTGNQPHYSILKQIQFIHLDDLCDAEIFLYEHPAAAGRYVCSSHDTTIHGLADMLRERYPEYHIPQRFPGIDDDLQTVRLSSKKLLDLGFKFRYTTMEEMYDGAIRTCREKGLIPLATAGAGGDGVRAPGEAPVTATAGGGGGPASVRAPGETDVTIGA